MRDQHPYRLAWAAVDAVIWFAAVPLAQWLRYDFAAAKAITTGSVLCGLLCALVHLGFGLALGPYTISHLRASFEEVLDLARAVVLTTVVVLTVVLVAGATSAVVPPTTVPRSVPLVAGAFSVGIMLAARMAVRAVRVARRGGRTDVRRVVVFGAGEGGRQLVRAMLRDPQSTYRPVALIDDSPRKARLTIEGVRVRGSRADLARVAARYDADALVVAVPSADAGLLRDLSERAAACDLPVLVLPAVQDIIGPPTSRDLRDVNLEDILGRRPIDLDATAIAESIVGRRVLVTGAGGSIGSELCRQIARFSPERLILLDRDESALQEVQLSLTGHGLLDSDDIVLADIRDVRTIEGVLERTRPDVVFHAAALKHLPLLERYPHEAWLTNVLGTLNVLTACQRAGVGTVVNISTDKAADPTCVLGYSKRVAERLTASFAATGTGRYVSVRFGNVLGSRGSVIHAFTAQIQAGGPVTVTHPEVERFFMLIPEACQLVLQASAMGGDGEVMVLDMGRPMRILDVARTLVRRSGRHDVRIVFTGLRPGEKLGEDLFSTTEDAALTSHPLVSAVGVPPLAPAAVHGTPPASAQEAGAWMRQVARDHDVPVPAAGNRG
ncbi:polysaccharide biosynthesis protein [Lapillicoccus jejuensis]|uniref:FlaA1/EpsC-like NDP-sugar epimerase n=1 Tax=Lapillicoccus jejuensis TaxID=402171 RepID=A0A542DVZ2_9MICO|nr:nucleoside-diphosphate sugar epimerase/dehydratase [Lapillicoccus jejuensis]TQJ07272.1 FlaA1/EpsC-like NDP-sugar epimerase [Lapillicoccus jejuensis]